MTAIETKSLKVGKYVDTAHVDTVIRNYKQKRWLQNSEAIGKEDTLSLWYSLQELEEFIQKAKSSGANGIRLHFGVYPENFADNPAGSNQLTMVLVATKNKETEEGMTEKNVYVATEKGARLLAYNYAGMCPTQCPSTKKPGTSEDPDPDWGGLGVTILDRGDKGMTII